MSKYITHGTVAGVLSFLAVVATAFGKPVLASYFSNPDAVTEILQAFSAFGAVYAGVSKGIEAPKAAK